MTEERILVLAPVGRDGPLACRVLERAGMSPELCATMDALCARIAEGAGAVLLTEEAVAGVAGQRLAAALSGQPAWSDLPLILFGARETSESGLANVTLLDRPVRTRTLLSAAAAALRARRRQYEVRRLLQELELSVRDRDQFLAMLGHELRNPLAAIVTASDLLVGGRDSTRAREVIHRQGRHLARLVDDLLDVSRVTRGKIVLREDRVDLRELVTQSLQGFEKAAAAQGVTLVAELQPVFVQGDVLRLQQVVGNLLSNAVKYTNAGGRVTVTLREDAQGVELRVADTGVGVSPEMLPRIFELFTQAPGALDRSQGGMGIGLTLVQRLVELHHGSVVARSDGLGKGTVFLVRLPSAPAEQHASQAAPRAGLHRRLRVIVVEDNPDARDVLQMALEQLGHAVVPCGDGTTAIARAADRPPDAMVVDLGLPGVDGFVVAREVRKALGGAVRLIALTGYGQSEDRHRALEAGFDSFLVKPAEIEAIERALQSR